MSMLAQQPVRFNWAVIVDNLPLFFAGLRLTIVIAAVSFLIATVLGVMVALARLSRFRIVAILAAGYINVLRAIPLLVFIVFVYYGIAIFFNLTFLTAIQAGMLAFSLQYSAWLGEIFRSGIQAVPKGQREAALSVGMSRAQTFVTVVLPQAVRIAIPPTGNMMVGMIKDSSLVYILGVPELFRNAQLLANRTFRYFEVYLAVVITYLLLTTGVYYAMKFLERRLEPRDLLATGVPAWSPFARRRQARLQRVQEQVREGVVAAI
jgi:His/Glu/Gln/Arg/opine family amino acid ABC transporter permease subunit